MLAWYLETGNAFQIINTQTAKKCFLQLTPEIAKNNLNECLRVLELQICVKTDFKMDHVTWSLITPISGTVCHL